MVESSAIIAVKVLDFPLIVLILADDPTERSILRFPTQCLNEVWPEFVEKLLIAV
jgi:hypothetical protein